MMENDSNHQVCCSMYPKFLPVMFLFVVGKSPIHGRLILIVGWCPILEGCRLFFGVQSGALVLAICCISELENVICGVLGMKIANLAAVCDILGLGSLVGRKFATSCNEHAHKIACIMFT